MAKFFEKIFRADRVGDIERLLDDNDFLDFRVKEVANEVIIICNSPSNKGVVAIVKDDDWGQVFLACPQQNFIQISRWAANSIPSGNLPKGSQAFFELPNAMSVVFR